MVLLIAIYLTLHIIRSYLSYLMYTADITSSKITPLSYTIIGIEFVCFFIDIGVVILFLVYFLEQRQNQRNSIRNQDVTSLWDRWHFCMVLTVLVAVDLARTCYRTIYMVSFDMQFNRDPPERFKDISQPQSKTLLGQIQFYLYLLFLAVSLVQFVVYEVFFYMIMLQEQLEDQKRLDEREQFFKETKESILSKQNLNHKSVPYTTVSEPSLLEGQQIERAPNTFLHRLSNRIFQPDVSLMDEQRHSNMYFERSESSRGT